MQTEREKMLGGTLYDPRDPELSSERRRARLLFKALNDTRDDEPEKRIRLIKELIPASGSDIWIEPPFFCDYGTNITLGDKVFFNFNCTVLDVAPVSIGSGVIFGPSVQIFSGTHPLNAKDRRTRLEFGKAVEIGEEVWVAGGVVICPGVRIGAQAVIGAGSVVTKNIPPHVLAAGVPCRPLHEIEG